jgi:hypothetical protein
MPGLSSRYNASISKGTFRVYVCLSIYRAKERQPKNDWFSEMHRSFIVETPVVNNNQQEESEPLEEKQSNRSSRLL